MSSPLLSGLSQIVATISPPSGGTDNTPVEVTNLKSLGSYNWINYEVPTLAIPGRPTAWKDRPIPIHLSKDMGAPFFDEGIARKCGSTLESLLRAIEVSQAGEPDFDLSKEEIDVVTNRRNLRALMHFAKSRSHGFRIDAQLALNGRTMILTAHHKPILSQQQSKAPTAHPRQARGQQQNKGFIRFDHVFERTSTEEHQIIKATDSNGSQLDLTPIGYYRIVRYDLLGLRLLVRSRVDAMLTIDRPAQPQFKPSLDPEIDDLSKAFERARLEPESADAPTLRIQGEETGLRHVNFGEHIPQSQLMDLKLAQNGQVKWGKVYPQYFLSQTPLLRVATQSTVQGRNSVTQLQTYNQNSLATQHNSQSQQFRNFISILKQMRQALQTHGSSSQPLAFVGTQRGDIAVHKIQKKSEYLSDEGLDKF